MAHSAETIERHLARAKAKERLRAFTEEADRQAYEESERLAIQGVVKDDGSYSAQDILDRWLVEGTVRRVPTGIEPLDRLCNGGLPVPWRMVIIGAPNASKTYTLIAIGDGFLDQGFVVGMLGVDEEPDFMVRRLAQRRGYTRGDLERRDPALMKELRGKLPAQARLYDARWTIEQAAEDIAKRAKAAGVDGALLIDSLHAVSSERTIGKQDPADRVRLADNMAALREAMDKHRLIAIATSEANRASYRSDAAADETNDMAAGAESRAIEYVARTMLMLRTPKGHPDVVHVRVPKNKTMVEGGEFWLRLDRERQTVFETDDPTDDPMAAAEAQAEQQERERAKVIANADRLRAILAKNPEGLGTRALRAAVRAAGLAWGVETHDAAAETLKGGFKGVRMVNSGTEHRPKWKLESTDQGVD